MFRFTIFQRGTGRTWCGFGFAFITAQVRGHWVYLFSTLYLHLSRRFHCYKRGGGVVLFWGLMNSPFLLSGYTLGVEFCFRGYTCVLRGLCVRACVYVCVCVFVYRYVYITFACYLD